MKNLRLNILFTVILIRILQSGFLLGAYPWYTKKYEKSAKDATLSDLI